MRESICVRCQNNACVREFVRQEYQTEKYQIQDSRKKNRGLKLQICVILNDKIEYIL